MSQEQPDQTVFVDHIYPTLPRTYDIESPAPGREVGEADEHDGGVEGGGRGEEDCPGNVGRVVQEAGQGHRDEKQPRDEDILRRIVVHFINNVQGLKSLNQRYASFGSFSFHK